MLAYRYAVRPGYLAHRRPQRRRRGGDRPGTPAQAQGALSLRQPARHSLLQGQSLHLLPRWITIRTHIPQTGTLDSLITLSEELPKQDASFTAVVAKTVDTLRNLLNNDPNKLSQHILVNETSVDDYLADWSWNEGRYGTQRSSRETVDALNKVRVYLSARSSD